MEVALWGWGCWGCCCCCRCCFAEAFICWISRVIFSVFMASRILAVAVGRRARTVKVQSSWFCSKRRRRFSLAMRSLLMRSRASLILFNTYWVAR